MSASTVSRPTERRALKRIRPPRLWPPVWLADRQARAKQAGDMYLEHVLGCMADRSIANGRVGE